MAQAGARAATAAGHRRSTLGGTKGLACDAGALGSACSGAAPPVINWYTLEASAKEKKSPTAIAGRPDASPKRRQKALPLLENAILSAASRLAQRWTRPF